MRVEQLDQLGEVGKRPDELGLVFVDMEGAVFDPVAERNRSAHPDALSFRGGDLVADFLAGDLALELGEGQQHVEGKSPHAGGRVEGLGHRDKGDAPRWRGRCRG